MSDNTYNGWSNFPTFSVAHLLQNNEPCYEAARRCRDAEELRAALYTPLFTDARPGEEIRLFRQMAHGEPGFVDEVNWGEVAELFC